MIGPILQVKPGSSCPGEEVKVSSIGSCGPGEAVKVGGTGSFGGLGLGLAGKVVNSTTTQTLQIITDLM